MGSLSNSQVSAEPVAAEYGQTKFHVVVVGAGLGGLSAAISCLREGLEVTILEKAKEFTDIGAGIQLPPNATRVMAYYDLLPNLDAVGAVKANEHSMLRYTDGDLIVARPDGWLMEKEFGHPWLVIHRADYHRVLRTEALRLGAKFRLDSELVSINFDAPFVLLKGGERIDADVIIGADGLWSATRAELLGKEIKPIETGDLAYRATIPVNLIKDPSLIGQGGVNVWCGPEKHAVLYPVRGRTIYNLVLIRPDNLPPGVSTVKGDIQEMRDTFKGWDPRLNEVIKNIDSVLKWRLCHMTELDTWVKGPVALLGDACHPSLPYQAQGAAMAAEDGATLGILLGLLSKSLAIDPSNRRSRIPEVLKLYESMRKRRTTTNVAGAVQNRKLYHLKDGPECEERDAELRQMDWSDPKRQSSWGWCDSTYMHDLMGFNTIADAKKRFSATFENSAFPSRKFNGEMGQKPAVRV